MSHVPRPKYLPPASRTIHGSLLQYFRPEGWVRQAAAFMDENLGGIFNLEIILEGQEDTFKAPATLQKLQQLEAFATQNPHVTGARSVLDYLRFINRALNRDDPRFARVPSTREEISQMLFLYELAGGEELQMYQTDDAAWTRLSLRTSL